MSPCRCKTPTSVTKFLTLRVADPEFFIDFEFDDKDPVKLVSAPSGCSASVAKPKPLEADDKQKLSESFFTNLSPGPISVSKWRAPPSSRAHDEARNRTDSALAAPAWRASAATALAQLSPRPFAVGGGEGGGGAEGGVTGWLHGRAVIAHPSHRGQGACAARRSGRRLGPDRPRPRLWRVSRRRARARQGGDRLVHAGQRKVAQTRRGDGADGGAAAGAGRDRARRRGRVCLQRDRLAR